MQYKTQYKMYEIVSPLPAAEAAGTGVGGPKRLFALTTCERHLIVYNGCCRDSATNLKQKN